MSAVDTSADTPTTPWYIQDPDAVVAPDERPYMRDIERVTRTRSEPMPLPENFNELVRNLPKPVQPPRDTGSKGRDPLIFQENGSPYRGFLEGRVDGQKYKLLLHLSNLELRAPGAAAT